MYGRTDWLKQTKLKRRNGKVRKEGREARIIW